MGETTREPVVAKYCVQAISCTVTANMFCVLFQVLKYGVCNACRQHGGPVHRGWQPLWFPLAEIERFLKDMQSKGRNGESDTIGQGSHAFAAQVLAGTLVAKKKASGVTSSSATAGALPSLRMLYCL